MAWAASWLVALTSICLSAGAFSDKGNEQVRRTTLLVGSAAVVAATVGWYLFRPELLFITKTVNEDLPGVASGTDIAAGGPSTVLANGHFRSVAHESSGVAIIHQLADGARVVRLTAFETSNGPDVRVYLVAASDAPDHETVTRAGFIDLGSLKGNKGDQNYAVPAGVDLGRYRSVTIWCARFGVNFATAPLVAQQQL